MNSKKPKKIETTLGAVRRLGQSVYRDTGLEE